MQHKTKEYNKTKVKINNCLHLSRKLQNDMDDTHAYTLISACRYRQMIIFFVC